MKSIKSQKIVELKELVSKLKSDLRTSYLKEGVLREYICKLEAELDSYKELTDNLQDELQNKID